MVAQEVKSLAGQTAKATEEISSQIGNMQLATEESVSRDKAIGLTIERISEIAALDFGCGRAAARRHPEHRPEAFALLRSGTAEVAANIRNAAQGAEETGETSSRMFESAQTLLEREPAPEGRGRKFLEPRTRCPSRGSGGAALKPSSLLIP